MELFGDNDTYQPMDKRPRVWSSEEITIYMIEEFADDYDAQAAKRFGHSYMIEVAGNSAGWIYPVTTSRTVAAPGTETGVKTIEERGEGYEVDLSPLVEEFDYAIPSNFPLEYKTLGEAKTSIRAFLRGRAWPALRVPRKKEPQEAPDEGQEDLF